MKQKITGAKASLSELQLRAIFESSQIGILVFNKDAKCIEMNQRGKQLFGFTLEELNKMDLASITHPDDLAQVTVYYQGLLNSDLTSFNLECRLANKEKGWFWGNVSIYALVEDDKVNSVVIMVLDVSDRKNAEQSAREAMNSVEIRALELELIRRVIEDLNKAITLEDAFKAVSTTILAIGDQRPTWIIIPEESGVVRSASIFDPENPTATIHLETKAQNSCTCVQKTVIGNLSEPFIQKRCGCRHLLGLEGKASHIAIPLVVRNKAYGVLNFGYDKTNPLKDSELELLKTVAAQLMITIDRIKLYQAEVQQRQILETMRLATTTISSSLDVNIVMGQLLEQIRALIPFDSGTILMVEGKLARVKYYSGYNQYGQDVLESAINMSFNIDRTHNFRQMVKSRTAFYIPDIEKDPNWIKTKHSGYFRSWLGAPIINEGEVIAFFALDKIEPDFFDHKSAEILTSFAGQAALSIQNARLYQAEKQRVHELETLHTILANVSSQLDLSTLLKDILTNAIDLLGGLSGELALYNEIQKELAVVVSKNLPVDTTGFRLDLGEGGIGKVAETHRPLVVENYQGWEGRSGKYNFIGASNFLFVPLLSGTQLFGVIAVGDADTARQFRSEDIEILKVLAQQAVIAINNARLFEAARTRADEADKIRQAGAAVVSTLKLDEVIDNILRQLAEVVPYDNAAVRLLEGRDLKVVGGHGFSDPTSIVGTVTPLSRSNQASRVIDQGKPVLLQGLAANSASLDPGNPNIQTWMGVPLIFGKHILGVLSLAASEPKQFSRDNIRLVTAFADQVSIALENARLYQDAIHYSERLSVIYQASQEMNASLNRDQVYYAIHKAASRLMPTDIFQIAVLSYDSEELTEVYAVDRNQHLALNKYPKSTGLYGMVFADGKPKIIDNIDPESDFWVRQIREGASIQEPLAKSAMVVPLQYGGKIIGVMAVQSYKKSAYSHEDQESLELLAANATIALENSRLFSEVEILAITDPLTRLYNRRYFFELANLEFMRCKRYGNTLSIIMLDIDHFKKVNDTYGHTTGDQVLHSLADACRENFRQVDLGRFGGEEYVILLPETDLEKAKLTAERLRHKVETHPMLTNRGVISMTISIGVAELSADCANLETLLDRSDRALYAAKRSGRNRVIVWNSRMKHKTIHNP